MSPDSCAAQQYGRRTTVILRQRFNIHSTVKNTTCGSTIQMESIVAFPWQQCTSERAKTYTAYLIRVTFLS